MKLPLVFFWSTTLLLIAKHEIESFTANSSHNGPNNNNKRLHHRSKRSKQNNSEQFFLSNKEDSAPSSYYLHHLHHHGESELNNDDSVDKMSYLQSTVSSSSSSSSPSSPSSSSSSPSSRRKLLEIMISRSILGLSATLATTTCLTPQSSHAACLPGDTSTDCIGVYKVPIDDNIKNMISTPEQLAKFAPDLRYVPPIQYPKNYKEAKEEILSLKNNVNELTSIVSKGDLTNAGIEILRIVPRITVSGKVVIVGLGNDEKLSMKAYRSDVAYNQLLASLGAVDIMIGQSIAGQLGSITAAQIQILEELRNANESYDELVKAIPSDFLG